MEKRRFISKLLCSILIYHGTSQRHIRYHQDKWMVKRKSIQITRNLHPISNIHKQNNFLLTNKRNGDGVQISYSFCPYIYVVVKTENHRNQQHQTKVMVQIRRWKIYTIGTKKITNLSTIHQNYIQHTNHNGNRIKPTITVSRLVSNKIIEWKMWNNNLQKNTYGQILTCQHTSLSITKNGLVNTMARRAVKIADDQHIHKEKTY